MPCATPFRPTITYCQAFSGSDGNIYPARIYDIDNVIDPMGAGDAFIAAYIHALLKFGDDSPKDINFALTASAIKNSIPGDFNLTTEEEITEVYENAGKSIG